MVKAMTIFTTAAGTRAGRVRAAAALGLLALGLSGCVVYPSRYSYGYGGGYEAPAYYAPPVVVGFGGGWGGGWGRGWGRGGWR